MNRDFINYCLNGYFISKLFNKKETQLITKFATNWFYTSCGINFDERKKFPINEYHKWYNSLNINHSDLCSAKNRYLYPSIEIQKIIKQNKKIKKLMSKLEIKKYKMWDDGWGWLGFRLVRPGYDDGYPLSKKNWGVAKGVISVWMPIIGRDPSCTLTLAPGSHLKEFDSYLPKNTKFTKGELRLSNKYKNKIQIKNPNLNNYETIIYSSNTLHSEKNIKIKKTRFNLEFRYLPII